MKKLFWSLIFVSRLTYADPSVDLSDFKAPLPEQMMSIASTRLQGMQTALGSTCSSVKLNASDDNVSQSYFCMPKQNLESVQNAFKEKSIKRVEINHENDLNFVKGVGVLTGSVPDTLANRSDDIGRTLGATLKAEVEDSTSKTYVRLKGEGFGKYGSQNGARRDEEGKYYLHFLEINNLRVGREWDINENKTRAAVEGEVENRNTLGKGYIAQPIQRAWHDKTEKNHLQYVYLDGSENKTTYAIKGGFKQTVDGQVGDIVCSAMGSAIAGFDSQGRAIFNPRIQGNISFGEKENPWIAFEAWREDMLRNRDFRSEYGVKVGTSFKVGSDVVVKPYYAVVKYKSEDDRAYSVGARGGEEPMHMIGVVVEYK